MKHLGDICKIDGSKIPPVDIITFGSPCQDLSVAGRREGLAGARSGLFMEAVRVIKEMRNATTELSMRGADGHIQPSVAVWENVPGAFSSNHGDDFRCVLEELARIKDPEVSIPMPVGGWRPSGFIRGNGFAITWRTHNAEFWGVPQRRKRISVVADFRDEPRPEVQFVSESLSGNFETGEQQGEEIAGIVGEDADSAICLQGNGIDRSDESGCNGRGWRRGGATPSMQQTDTQSAISFQERAGKPGGGKGILIQDERIGAMSTSANQYVCDPCREYRGGQVHDAISPSDEVCKTLNTMCDPMKVLVESGGAANHTPQVKPDFF